MDVAARPHTGRHREQLGRRQARHEQGLRGIAWGDGLASVCACVADSAGGDRPGEATGESCESEARVACQRVAALLLKLLQLSSRLLATGSRDCRRHDADGPVVRLPVQKR